MRVHSALSPLPAFQLAACVQSQSEDYAAGTSLLVLPRGQVHDAGSRLNPFAIPLLAHHPKPGAITGGCDHMVLARGSPEEKL